MIGDSWASAVESDTGLDRGWPEIMELPEQYRQGISGSRAEEWADDHGGRLMKAISTDSDAVIISLLGNDARHAISDGVITPEEIASGYSDLRKVVTAMIRPLTVVLLYADPFCGADPRSEKAVPLINGAIMAACGGLPVTFAKTYNWLSQEHFDGKDIHPNRAGHEVISKNLDELCLM